MTERRWERQREEEAFQQPYRVVTVDMWNYPLEDIMITCRVSVPSRDTQQRRENFSRLHLKIITDVRAIEGVMMEAFDINKTDFYGTLLPYALSLFQHEYHVDLTAAKNRRAAKVLAGEREELNAELENDFEFFERMRTGKRRVERSMYADPAVVAAIGDNAEYFNLSKTDMTQIMLAMAFVRWKAIHQEYKDYFENEVIKRFDRYTRGYPEEPAEEQEEPQDEPEEDEPFEDCPTDYMTTVSELGCGNTSCRYNAYEMCSSPSRRQTDIYDCMGWRQI
jgi:hypothetical protein